MMTPFEGQNHSQVLAPEELDKDNLMHQANHMATPGHYRVNSVNPYDTTTNRRP